MQEQGIPADVQEQGHSQQGQGHCQQGQGHYRADVLLGLLDSLHLGQVRNGSPFANALLVLHLQSTFIREGKALPGKLPKAQEELCPDLVESLKDFTTLASLPKGSETKQFCC